MIAILACAGEYQVVKIPWSVISRAQPPRVLLAVKLLSRSAFGNMATILGVITLNGVSEIEQDHRVSGVPGIVVKGAT